MQCSSYVPTHMRHTKRNREFSQQYQQQISMTYKQKENFCSGIKPPTSNICEAPPSVANKRTAMKHLCAQDGSDKTRKQLHFLGCTGFIDSLVGLAQLHTYSCTYKLVQTYTYTYLCIYIHMYGSGVGELTVSHAYSEPQSSRPVCPSSNTH